MTKIVGAAYRLMSQKGYESTSISQIAKEAGVSKGLMYNYFHSKEELLIQLINQTMGEGDRLMAEIISENPEETLANLFHWFFNEIRNNMEEWRFLSELMFKIEKFPFLEDFFVKKMKEYVTFIGALLKEIGFKNPKQEAQLIAGLFDGIGIQFLVIGEEYPIDEMEVFLINKYCKHE